MNRSVPSSASGAAPIPFDDALTRMLARAHPPGGREQVPTVAADGRVLAEDVRSGIDVPAWDNAQMDGYAVRSAELAAAGPAHGFVVSQRIPAGTRGAPLAAGTVARIFTGAALPEGADAVVMQEDSRVLDAGDNAAGIPARVAFSQPPEPGLWVRRTGEDIRAGAVILPAGTPLTPQATGLAASIGASTLTVVPRLRVACFFTGDELVMPGEPLPPGGIYNSNRFVLTALLARLGCVVEDLGIIGDSLDATRRALRDAAGRADVIITCGGMSVGEEDHVRPAVETEGELTMWQVAMKPGKPLACGAVRRADGGHAHFIGLPGNPVSAFATFLLFARPFLLRLAGVADVSPLALTVEAGFDWPRPDRRREFLRASVDPASGRLALFPNQGSAVLTSTVVGQGFVDNPPGQAIHAGDRVRFLPFASLLAQAGGSLAPYGEH